MKRHRVTREKIEEKVETNRDWMYNRKLKGKSRKKVVKIRKKSGKIKKEWEN